MCARSSHVFQAFDVNDVEAICARDAMLEDPDDRICAEVAEHSLRRHLLHLLEAVASNRFLVALHVLPQSVDVRQAKPQVDQPPNYPLALRRHLIGLFN